MGPQEHQRLNDNPLKSDLDAATIANKVARQVESYWAGLGHFNVRCWVERVSVGPNRGSSYEVRSNLVRGLPPG